MKVPLNTDEIEMIKFILGIYNTKDKVEETKVSNLYNKFCNLSDIP